MIWVRIVTLCVVEIGWFRVIRGWIVGYLGEIAVGGGYCIHVYGVYMGIYIGWGMGCCLVVRLL